MFQNTKNIKPFEKKVWLSSPTMHGDEQKWVNDAFVKNWITTAGENINEVEKIVAERIGVKYAVALSCGTAASFGNKTCRRKTLRPGKTKLRNVART